jgi:hypothetical protein
VSGELARQPLDLGVQGVRFDRGGLQLDRVVDSSEWESVGYVLGQLHDACRFALGDWILIGEDLFGDDIVAQAVEVTGRSKATLLEYARVARQMPRERRRPSLSFTIHQLVAAKGPRDQDEWLDRVEANGWSTEELRGALQTGALSTRLDRSPARVEVLELVEDISRAVLRAAERRGDGYSTVPDDVLDRLANALGEEREPAEGRLVDVPATTQRPEWA